MNGVIAFTINCLSKIFKRCDIHTNFYLLIVFISVLSSHVVNLLENIELSIDKLRGKSFIMLGDI